MKKRSLFTMVAALLFSWAGFAQEYAVFDEEGSFIDQPTTHNTEDYDPVKHEFIQSGTYGETTWSFEGNSVRAAGYTGVRFQYAAFDHPGEPVSNPKWGEDGEPEYFPQNTSNFRVILVYGYDEPYTRIDDSYSRSGTVDIPFVSNTGLPLINVTISGSGQSTNAFKLTIAKFIEYRGSKAPDYFTPPIDFEVEDLLGYKFSGVKWNAPTAPIAHMVRTWAWGVNIPGTEDNIPYSFVSDPDSLSNTCIHIVGDQDSPWTDGTIIILQVKLPDGKTFGDIEKVKFRVKCQNYGWWQDDDEESDTYGEWFPDRNEERSNWQVLMAASDKDYSWSGRPLIGGIAGGGDYGPPDVKYPLYFRSRSAYNMPIGEWTEIIVNTEDFWSMVTNAGMYEKNDDGDGLYEDGEPELINGLNAFQFAIGINKPDMMDHYFDDINFKYFGEGWTGVENVVAEEAPAAIKVYNIPGGLAIAGAEKAAIYGIDGSLIATAKGEISLPKGVYIVKAGNQVVKAIVK